MSENNEQKQYQKALNEHNWKLYNASTSKIDILNRRQSEEYNKLDKWIMTIAAGSFGLSFALINQIVPVGMANHILLLIVACACFLSVLVLGLIGFMASGLSHTVLAEEEAKALPLMYEGREPEYKKRSIFFNANMVLTQP